MTDVIAFDHVAFRYPEAESRHGSVSPWAIADVTLTIPAGAMVLVVGPSGAGKSTLLRCINGLVPHFTGGTFVGRLEVMGLDPIAAGPETMCRHVGFVFQDPEAQFVMDRVEDEIAFALENAAMPPPEMHARVEEVLARLDLVSLRHRPLVTLSGGEKQRVAIAAALALRPRILVLDEPTSQLDPQAAEELLGFLARLGETSGLTLVLAEHRLERVLDFADLLVYVSGGAAPVIFGDPASVLSQVDLAPPVARVGKALGWSPLPVTLAQGARFAVDAMAGRKVDDALLRRDRGDEGADQQAAARPPILEAAALQVAYGDVPVLRGVTLSLYAGEVTVLMGRNGAGKSTLLKSLIGLVRPQQGHVWLVGRDTAGVAVADICREVAYLPQDPNALLFADTVREELNITLRNHSLEPSQVPVAPDALLAELGLADKREAYPRDLSVGERQRVALAAITVTHPKVILLDEPTRGLDYAAKAGLIELIRRWRAAGLALLLVTHDVELAADVADRVLLMVEGRIVADGSPWDVMGHSDLLAPQIARLFPDAGWLTAEEAAAALMNAGDGTT